VTDSADIVQLQAEKLAYAVACAEGFFAPHSLPSIIHNPGDLELGNRGFGTQAGKTCYKKADPEADIKDGSDGWSALRRQCVMMLSGASLEYSVNDSFDDVARKWTGGDHPEDWVKNVCEKLNIQPDWTLREFVFGRSISA
jgi:hypothetical protein